MADNPGRYPWRRSFTILTAVALAVFLLPVGVHAATSLVRIQDANSNVAAQVDGGKLRVGDGSGPMTVNGSVSVASAAPYGPAVEPFQQRLHLPSSECPGANIRTERSFTVPAGKILAIEHVTAVLTGDMRAPTYIETTLNGGVARISVEQNLSAADTYLQLDSPLAFAGPGTAVVGSGACPQGYGFDITVVGYLVKA